MLKRITTTPDVTVAPLRFVPGGFDASDLDALTALCETLLARPVGSAEELAAWVEDWSEIGSAVLSAASRRRIAMTRNTADAALREAHVAFQRDIVPAWRKLDDELSRQYLASGFRAALPPRFAMFDKRTAVGAELFRDANVSLLAKDVEIGARYFKQQGAATVEFRGERLTLQQCMSLLEDPDRELRKQVYLAACEVRAGMRDDAEGMLEQMLELRGRIAANAGFDDFLAYRFRDLTRFDYTPEDCRGFCDAVEKVVVPVLCERVERRKRALGIERFMPYDRRVDPSGAAPPMAQDQADLVETTRRVFGAVDPVFEAEFDILVRNDLLDLWSRPDKAPGGYNASLPDIRLPFIFGNAAGCRGDLRLMLHEGGHAFHTIATRDEPVADLRHAPIEFSEVASMAMEQFGLERLEAVYEPADARAVAISALEDRLVVFCWVATVDSFQRWLYTNPGHSRAERETQWVQLRGRFSPHMDWSGLERFRSAEWTGQLHIFMSPLYYIEYAIASVGALQIWQRFRADHRAAVADYRRALALGGSAPLPELFEAAGARFGMDEGLLAEVVGGITGRLAELDG